MTEARRDHETVLDEHLGAENRHDVAAIMATFAADAVVVFGGVPYQGHDTIRRLHEELGFGGAGAFSDLAIVELRRHRAGDVIVVEQELRGTHTGAYEGYGATGREVAVPVCTIYEFDADGLIVSERPHVDRWLLMRQLGGS